MHNIPTTPQVPSHQQSMNPSHRTFSSEKSGIH